MNRLRAKIFSMLLMAGALTASIALPEVSAAPRVTLGGAIGIELPRGSISVRVGGDRYHFHDGRYYRKSGHGYVVVRAPRGAVIKELPRGYRKVVVRGRPYYRYRDVYYERGSRGYMVVDVNLDSQEASPVADKADTSDFISVWRGEEELLFKDGQFFRNTSKGLVWVETPVDGLAPELPENVRSVWYEDIEYFESRGIYFRKSPDGFRVVEAPWAGSDQKQDVPVAP